MTTEPPDRRLNRKEAARFLTERGFQIAPATLAKYASIGGGPLFVSFRRKPLYLKGDLLAWAATRTTGLRRSTSDPGSRAFPAEVEAGR